MDWTARLLSPTGRPCRRKKSPPCSSQYPELHGLSRLPASVLARCPQPASLPAQSQRVFVKRHARPVRDAEGLREEHQVYGIPARSWCACAASADMRLRRYGNRSGGLDLRSTCDTLRSGRLRGCYLVDSVSNAGACAIGRRDAGAAASCGARVYGPSEAIAAVGCRLYDLCRRQPCTRVGAVCE